MVHVFSHLDLVEQSSLVSISDASVKPIRTWTKHHLAVTALVALNGGRIVSASEDGQVIIMELSSGATVATFQMPDPIRSLTTDGERQIFAGSVKGTVHIVNLGEFALHQTVQIGATIVHHPSRQEETAESRVFGDSTAALTSSFQRELRGHDSAITSLVVFEDEQDGRITEYLVSGDASGLIRIWDARRGCCVRFINPWSQTAIAAQSITSSKGKTRTEDDVQKHPVTSIHVIRDQANPLGASSEGDFSTASNGQENKRLKGSNGITSLLSPLQKYVSVNDTSLAPLPYLESYKGKSSLFTGLGTFSFERALMSLESKKRIEQHEEAPDEQSKPDTGNSTHQHKEEIERLKKELEDANATIQRWEVVNNKLVAKLKERRD